MTRSDDPLQEPRREVRRDRAVAFARRRMSRRWIVAVLAAFVAGYGLAAWLDDMYHVDHPDERYGDRE